MSVCQAWFVAEMYFSSILFTIMLRRAVRTLRKIWYSLAERPCNLIASLIWNWVASGLYVGAIPGFCGTTYSMSLLSSVYWVVGITSPKKLGRGCLCLGLKGLGNLKLSEICRWWWRWVCLLRRMTFWACHWDWFRTFVRCLWDSFWHSSWWWMNDGSLLIISCDGGNSWAIGSGAGTGDNIINCWNSAKLR